MRMFKKFGTYEILLGPAFAQVELCSKAGMNFVAAAWHCNPIFNRGLVHEIPLTLVNRNLAKFTI